ncbi:hypothetical protein SDC9_82753 [bioreactor metagenome]|uniref:Uncharacterized protein n=1 Tax=bioreactor metagenome TaxID=1076179 RepID=A0A644Z7A2_9ZZZZ
MGVEPLRQRLDVVEDVGLPGRRAQVLRVDAVTEEADVLRDRAGEQPGVLRDERDPFAPPSPVDVLERHAGRPQGAVRRRPQPQQQLGEGRLAGARGPDDAQGLARLEPERDTGQGGPLRGVRVRDVGGLERHHSVGTYGAAGGGGLGVALDHLVDPFEERQEPGDRRRGVGQLLAVAERAQHQQHHRADHRQVAEADQGQCRQAGQHRAVRQRGVDLRLRALQHLGAPLRERRLRGQLVDPVGEGTLGAVRLHLQAEGAELGDGVGEVEAGAGVPGGPAPDRPAHRRQDAADQTEGEQHGGGGQRVDRDAGGQESDQAQRGGDRRGEHRHGLGDPADERGEELLEPAGRLGLLDRPAGVQEGVREPLALLGRHHGGERCREVHGDQAEDDPQHQAAAGDGEGGVHRQVLAVRRADHVLAPDQGHPDAGQQDDEQGLEQRAGEGGEGEQGDPALVRGEQPPHHGPAAALGVRHCVGALVRALVRAAGPAGAATATRLPPAAEQRHAITGPAGVSRWARRGRAGAAARIGPAGGTLEFMGSILPYGTDSTNRRRSPVVRLPWSGARTAPPGSGPLGASEHPVGEQRQPQPRADRHQPEDEQCRGVPQQPGHRRHRGGAQSGGQRRHHALHGAVQIRRDVVVEEADEGHLRHREGRTVQGLGERREPQAAGEPEDQPPDDGGEQGDHQHRPHRQTAFEVRGHREDDDLAEGRQHDQRADQAG